MKKLFLSFLLCGGIGVSPAFSQTYEELSERAATATEQDSLTQAEGYIRQALKLEPANPHNALLFSNLGIIQQRRQQYEQALESYTLALNIAPRAVPVLLNRAALYLELGKEDLARIDYSLVLDMDKDNQEALLMGAYAYMQQRNYKSARADYEHLLKIVPQSYNGQLGLAMLEQKEKKYEAALSILNSMLAGKEVSSAVLTASQTAVLYTALGNGRFGGGHPSRFIAAGSLPDARATLSLAKEKGVGKARFRESRITGNTAGRRQGTIAAMQIKQYSIKESS